MKWIEVIQVRSTGCDKNLLKTELLKLANEKDKNTMEEVIMVYGRVLVDTDYTIQIIHKAENVEKNGSALGLHLASALKAFGLVNHSLWVALDNKETNLGI